MKKVITDKRPIFPCHKAINEYFQFFTTKKGVDIVPYAYIQAGYLYDEILLKCASYYLYNDEVDLIFNNKIKLCKYLEDVEAIIDIGPGSSRAVLHKTIPMVNKAINLKNYYAIDHSEAYLINACSLVKKSFKNLNINAIEHDLMGHKQIFFKEIESQRKAVMLLGSTFSNFMARDQIKIINKIFNLMESGDKFFISFDTNRNEELLLAAYDNEYNAALFRASLDYFCRVCPDFEQHLDKFSVNCAYNNQDNFIEMYFKAKLKFSFEFPGFGNIVIEQGQELRGMKSRKYDVQTMVRLLEKNGFRFQEILSNSNKMKMLILSKK